jgi:hypothetical protein
MMRRMRTMIEGGNMNFEPGDVVAWKGDDGEWAVESYFWNWPTKVPVILLMTKAEVDAKIAAAMIEEDNRHHGMMQSEIQTRRERVALIAAHDALIRAESAQEIAALKEEIKQLLLMMDTLGTVDEWTDEDGGPMVSWTGTSDSWFITHRHARALLKEEPI